MSNAIKFTAGGSITIEAEWQPDATPSPDSIATSDGSSGPPPVLTVSVRDTGVGIPHHELTAIFEKFHQVAESVQERAKGTGLGLALCREIIHHLKGEIWCESDIGKGSRFSFTLPLLLPIVERSTVEPSPSQPSASVAQGERGRM